MDLESSEESAFVSSLLTGDSWTGGLEEGGRWRWEGGAPWTWPPPQDGAGRCLAMRSGEASQFSSSPTTTNN